MTSVVPYLCRKNCNGNCTCTPIHPDQLHMYTQVCALSQDSIIFTPIPPVPRNTKVNELHMYTHSASSTSYVHPFRQCKLHMYTQHVHWSASYVHLNMCILIFLKGKSSANDPMVLIVIYYKTIDRVPEDFWCFETILPQMIPWY